MERRAARHACGAFGSTENGGGMAPERTMLPGKSGAPRSGAHEQYVLRPTAARGMTLEHLIDVVEVTTPDPKGLKANGLAGLNHREIVERR